MSEPAKTELWTVPIAEARAFLDALPGAVRTGGDAYAYENAAVTLSEAPPLELFGKSLPRVAVTIEGDAEEFRRVFRLRFLKAGG